MTDKQTQSDDQAFERWLSGESELSEQYSRLAENRSVPESLDERILNAARAEVEPVRSGAWHQFYQTWNRPLAMAATVILSVGLVTFYFQRHYQAPMNRPGTVEESVGKMQKGASPQQAVLNKQEKEKALLSGSVRAAPDAESLSKDDGVLAERIISDAMMPGAENVQAPAAPALPVIAAADEVEEARVQAGTEQQRSDESRKRMGTSEQPVLRAERQFMMSRMESAFSPEDELKRISYMRALGKFEQADKMLRQFYRLYPDYPADRIEALIDATAPLRPAGPRL